MVAPVEDSFVTHVADPDESQLAKLIKSTDFARMKIISASLPSGTSWSMTAPSESEVGRELFNAPPQSTQELQVKERLSI